MPTDEKKGLQDIFLNACRKSKAEVMIFLINGVKLQGTVFWFDMYCVLLRREGRQQLIYKHAISTVAPLGAIQLNTEEEERAPVELEKVSVA